MSVDHGTGPRCPVTAREGRYLLTFCLPAGHRGEHWCNNIQDTQEDQ